MYKSSTFLTGNFKVSTREGSFFEFLNSVLNSRDKITKNIKRDRESNGEQTNIFHHTLYTCLRFMDREYFIIINYLFLIKKKNYIVNSQTTFMSINKFNFDKVSYF